MKAMHLQWLQWQQYWLKYPRRDRQIVLITLAVILVFSSFFFWIRPMAQLRAERLSALARTQVAQADFNRNLRTAQQLPTEVKRSTESLDSAVRDSLTAFTLTAQTLAGASKTELSLQFEHAPLSAVLDWLDAIEHVPGVSIKALNLQRGTGSARAQLSGQVSLQRQPGSAS